MSNGNGNGEVQKLVALKHGYKDEITQVEEDLKAKFEAELAAAKKDLKDKYLDKIVEWFYSNGFNGNGSTQAPPPPSEPTPTLAQATQGDPGSTDSSELSDSSESSDSSALTTPVCNDCGAELQQNAKFCTQCAAPVESETKAETNRQPAPVAPAGRMTYPRGQGKAGYQAPTDKRLNDWSRTQRR